MPQKFINPQDKISYLFVGLTAVVFVLAVIGLIQISYQTTIIIYSDLESIEVNLTENIDCRVVEKAGTIEETFTPRALVTMEDFANGDVMLINNSDYNQTLVANTRLLTPEGLLFRLIQRVVISARQKVKTEVRADKVGELYEIGPTRFTIPGLSTILQEKIYAESNEQMTGGVKKVGIVTQKDIDEATNQLEDKLSKNLVEDLKKELGNQNMKMAVHLEIINFYSSAKANDEKDEFTVKLELKLTAALLNEGQLMKLAQEKLAAQAPKGKKLEKVDLMTFAYRLTKYDLNNQKATLEIYLAGSSILSEDNIALAKENFLGRNQAEIKNYLANIEGIKEIKVRFSPFFVKKSPQSTARINIIVKPSS